PGSVIVDLAVERGGNVEGAVAGKVATTANGVKIVGHLNVPGRVASSSSLLYARNLYAFVESMVDKESGILKVDPEDELVKATLLTHDGKIVHPNFQDLKIEAAKPAAPKKPAAKPAAAAATAKTDKTKAAPSAPKKRSGAATKAKA